MKPEHALMAYLTYRVLHFFFWVIKEELRDINVRRDHPGWQPPSSIAE